MTVPARPPQISGTTRLYAVLGDPIAQVQAPGLLNPLFDRLGVDAVLVPVHATRDNLVEVVRGLQRVDNLDGLLVTLPHKMAACRLADRVSRTVAVAGSTNALRREPDGSWFADNFDGVGFVSGLRHAGHDPAGRHVSLIGAGGAGSAIAVALLTAGVSRLTVHDPDTTRLHTLIDRLHEHWPGQAVASAVPALGGVDVVVNATPLGLRADDPLPFPPEDLAPGRVVADIIMKPHETPLLRAAAALGHQVHHGIHMLHQQIPAYRDFFRLG